MNITQMLLIAIWAGISGNYFMDYLGFARPIVSGLVIGIILQDISQGVIIGATIESMFLGIFTVGAALAPDYNLASIIGISLGISSGFGTEVAVSLALPIALLGQFIMIAFVYPGNLLFLHRADKLALENKTKTMETLYVLGGMGLWFIKGFLPVILALTLGAGAVETLFNALPVWLIEGFSVVGGLLPAVGFALLLNVIGIDKTMWALFGLGFVLSSYIGLDILAITIISIAIIALLNYNKKGEQNG